MSDFKILIDDTRPIRVPPPPCFTAGRRLVTVALGAALMTGEFVRVEGAWTIVRDGDRTYRGKAVGGV